MRQAHVLADGSAVRWSELPGAQPARVYLHGLGSAAVPAFLGAVTHPPPAGRQTLLVDLLGFGFSDRPAGFGYSVEDHALAVAAALDTAGVQDVDLIGHSLGGSVAILLAHLRPDLVRRLVAAEPNLVPWDGTASVDIARQSEQDFVDRGFAALLAEAEPSWAATLRSASPVAVHRTSLRLCQGSTPVMREALLGLAIPRTLVWGALTPPPPQLGELRAAGVGYLEVPAAGHVMMEDNLPGFVTTLAEALPAR